MILQHFTPVRAETHNMSGKAQFPSRYVLMGIENPGRDKKKIIKTKSRFDNPPEIMIIFIFHTNGEYINKSIWYMIKILHSNLLFAD